MTTIFWAGDSTVKQNDILAYPQTGIGQVFHRYVDSARVRIENVAENGRSTKSFLDEGRLAAVYDRIRAGDFFFIQFGHNDEKAGDPARYADPKDAFPDNLRKFVNVARNKNAAPVLITPATRWDRNNPNAPYRHDDWAESCRRAAGALDVALVDLTRMSEELVDALGERARAEFYMNLPAGAYPAYPNGLTDGTHLQPLGALAFAGLVARGLYALGGEYRALLCRDVERWLERDGRRARAVLRRDAEEIL